MYFRMATTILAIGALLAGCGGGSSTPEAVTMTCTAPKVPGSDGSSCVDVASVVSIIPDRLMYRNLTQFKITGVPIEGEFTVTTKWCSGLKLLPGSTPTEKTISCTVTATGPDAVSVEVKDVASGAVLMARTFSVPEPQVTMTTTLGSLVVELNPGAAPVTVDNFLQYVQDGFYANTLFHRVIAGFVAQGGMLTTVPAEQTGLRAAIVLESNKGLKNLRGTLAMARTSVPNSATSQFYFNLADNTGLDYVSDAQPGYAVFGKIAQGLAVLDAIGSVPTATRYGLPNFPVTDVVVQTIVQTQ